MSKGKSQIQTPSVLTYYNKSKTQRDQDPIKAMAQCQVSYRLNEEGYTARKYALIVEGYDFALKAVDDPKLMRRFFADEYFAQFAHAPKATAILRCSMRYLLASAAESPDYDRARTYAAALADAFKARKPPEEVAAMLEEKGIDALHDEAVVRKREETESGSSKTGAGGGSRSGSEADQVDKNQDGESDGADNHDERNHNDDGYNVEGGTNDDDSDGNEEKITSSETGNKQKKVVKKATSDNDDVVKEEKTPKPLILRVEVSERQLMSALAMDVGERATLLIERVAGDTKSVRIILVYIKKDVPSD